MHSQRTKLETKIACILDENGYNKSPATTWFRHTTADELPLILPYVVDGPARAINKGETVKIANCSGVSPTTNTARTLSLYTYL